MEPDYPAHPHITRHFNELDQLFRGIAVAQLSGVRRNVLVLTVILVATATWYAAFRAVALCALRRNGAQPRQEPDRARAAAPGHYRLRPGWQTRLYVLRRAADRRAAQPRLAFDDRCPAGRRRPPVLFAQRHRPCPHCRRGVAELPRRPDSRGRQHHYAAAGESVAAHARAHLRTQDQGDHAGGSARGALHEAADTRGVSQHRVPRRGLLRRRSCLTRLLQQAGRRPRAARGGAAGRAGALAVQ